MKVVKQKDLQAIYKYPTGHQWEDNYKIQCGWLISDGLYRDIGSVEILDKKKACAEFNRRAKNKEYRLEGEKYLDFKRRMQFDVWVYR